jgi:hypothetical protein
MPLALALALGLSILGANRLPAMPPSMSDISYIEKKINLPQDAPGPLSSYERYYAWSFDNGRKYIYAEYVYKKLLKSAESETPSHIHAVAEDAIPSIANGGCGVITFYFDPRGDRTPSMLCNAADPPAAP